MMSTATHFVVQDWFSTPEGKDVRGSLVDRKTGKRKTFGMIIHNFIFYLCDYLASKTIMGRRLLPVNSTLLISIHLRYFFHNLSVGLLERPSFPPQLLPDEFLYKIFISGKGGGWQNKYCRQTDGKQNTFKSQ